VPHTDDNLLLRGVWSCLLDENIKLERWNVFRSRISIQNSVQGCLNLRVMHPVIIDSLRKKSGPLESHVARGIVELMPGPVVARGENYFVFSGRDV
jgi:hypothetical protein